MNKTNTTNVKIGTEAPMFLLKLVDLLQAEDLKKYVSWNDNGTSFIIKNSESFSKFVLPKYFKHNKFQSFVRQLNLYGFRKVTPINHGLVNQQGTEEFRHPFFLKDRSDLLPLIKRKVTSTNKYSDVISQVLDEVNEIKDTQMEITTSLLDIKRENDDLWREVVSLRQKHAQQQKVVNHLVKFLLSLVQRHGMGRKRMMPISWKESGNDNIEPSSKMANQTFDNSASTASLNDLLSAKQSSPEGPLITELLSTSPKPYADSSRSASVSTSQSLANSNELDISKLIDSIATPDNSIQAPAEALAPLASELNVSSNTLNHQDSNLSSVPSRSTDSSEINKVLASNATTPTVTVESSLLNVTSPISITSPTTNSNTVEIEPSLFLNIPSNSAAKTSDKDTSLDNALAISNLVSSPETPALSKSIQLAPTPIYKKKVKLHQQLNSNMKKVENNLQSIQSRLSKSDQYHLDYDMLEDLFNGQAILPPPTSNSGEQLPIPIPLTPTNQNELVPYTGDSFLDLTTNNDENETNFDDLSSLLS